jgi:hypothetical protein
MGLQPGRNGNGWMIRQSLADTGKVRAYFDP